MQVRPQSIDQGGTHLRVGAGQELVQVGLIAEQGSMAPDVLFLRFLAPLLTPGGVV
jgi:hypothetical protein